MKKLPYHKRSRRATWPMGLLGLSMALGLGSGCGSAGPARPRKPWHPVTPQRGEASTKMFRQFEETCRNANKPKATAGPARELVLSCPGRGRDFREPKGPDGYVLKVIPLSGEFRQVQEAAEVIIVLYDAPPGEGRRKWEPLRVWHVPAEALERYWIQSHLLDGYLFGLDWGQAPEGSGFYVFEVLFEYRQGEERYPLCGKLRFEDTRSR